MNYENILTKLFERLPEFLQYNDYKELLEKNPSNADNKYVIFAIFERFFISCFVLHRNDLVRKISDFLEEMASSENDPLETLLVTGFLEDLNPNAEYYSDIKKTFGEKTKKHLKAIEDYKP